MTIVVFQRGKPWPCATVATQLGTPEGNIASRHITSYHVISRHITSQSLIAANCHRSPVYHRALLEHRRDRCLLAPWRLMRANATKARQPICRSVPRCWTLENPRFAWASHHRGRVHSAQRHPVGAHGQYVAQVGGQRGQNPEKDNPKVRHLDGRLEPRQNCQRDRRDRQWLRCRLRTFAPMQCAVSGVPLCFCGASEISALPVAAAIAPEYAAGFRCYQLCRSSRQLL